MPAPGADYVVFRVTGKGYVVLNPSRKQASGVYHDLASAQARCDRLNAELDRRLKRGPRACMCCGETFASEGIGNRLCHRCRHLDGGPAVMAFARPARRSNG